MADAVADTVRCCLAAFDLLDHSEVELLHDWLELVETLQVRSTRIDDLKLAAAMRLHGIGTILTRNGRDFRDVPDITTLDPEQIETEPPLIPEV